MTNFEPSWQSARRPLGRLREATADLLAMLLEWWDATNSIPMLRQEDPMRDSFGNVVRRARQRRRRADSDTQPRAK